MSASRSGSLRKSLHSDVGRKRSPTALSTTVSSAVATLDNLGENQDHSTNVASARLTGAQALSELDQIDRDRWSQFPRLSTVLDDTTTGQLDSRIDSLKFSNDELLETFSNGCSSDDESLLNSRRTLPAEGGNDSSTLSPNESSNKLRRAMSNSSVKASSGLRRMGLKLRGVPSALLSRSTNREMGIPLTSKSFSGNPSQFSQRISTRRRSIGRALSRVMHQGKENESPDVVPH